MGSIYLEIQLNKTQHLFITAILETSKLKQRLIYEPTKGHTSELAAKQRIGLLNASFQSNTCTTGFKMSSTEKQSRLTGQEIDSK